LALIIRDDENAGYDRRADEWHAAVASDLLTTAVARPAGI